MGKIYKIYPPIGIARVGNKDLDKRLAFRFVGRPDETGSAYNYKENKQIVPKGAGFKVIEHETNTAGEIIKSTEINLNTATVAVLEWKVQLANKKAAFFKFDYKPGETTNNTAGRRNTDFANWVMEPAPMSISGKDISNKQIFHKKTSPNRIPDTLLGSLWTDALGNLVVHGGKGMAASPTGTPISGDSFNSPGWYDDVADGPVTVTLRFKEQAAPVTVEPSWVIIGPPDFAPPLRNIVTIYDVLFNNMCTGKMKLSQASELYLKNFTHLHDIYSDFKSNGFKKLSSYIPHFHDDIFPILIRGQQTKYVSRLGNAGHGGNIKGVDFLKLTDAQRKQVFDKMRLPLGDSGTGGNMPLMHGDSYGQSGQPDKFLAITKVQHEMLRLWSEGKFYKSSDFLAPRNLFDFSLEPLKNTVGGAFAVGIESGWLIRNPKIYASPFRIDHNAMDQYKAPGYRRGKISAGYFTRQLAEPWHADFTSCSLTDNVAWWPAQRPDEVYADDDLTKPMVPWFRDSAGNALVSYMDMINKWHEMGFVMMSSAGVFREHFKN